MTKKRADVGRGREEDFFRLVADVEIDGWEGVKFRDISIHKSILNDNLFDHMEVKNSTFNRCDFTDSSIDCCRFEDVTFKDCMFSNTTMVKTKLIRCDFISCRFIESDLSQSEMERGSMQECFAFKSSFEMADWESVAVYRSTLWDCNFTDITITKCRFSASDLEGSTFTGAGLYNCTFSDCEVTDTGALLLKRVNTANTKTVFRNCVYHPYKNPHLTRWRDRNNSIVDSNIQRPIRTTVITNTTQTAPPPLAAHLTWAKPIILEV